MCNAGTGEACPRCESSCVCTSCSGPQASFHTPHRQLPASRSLRSHRFWGGLWSVGFLGTFFFGYYSFMCKNETGLTYIEHNVSCVGNKMTTFRKDNRCMIYRYHIMIGHHDFSSKIIDRSIIWDTRSAITYLIPPIGCFSDFGVCFESSWLLIGGGLCLPALRAAQAILGPRFWPRGACKGFLIKSNPSFSSLS